MSELLELPTLHVRGTASELGEAHGEAMRDRIRGFVDQRLQAFAEYSAERGGASLQAFLELGAACQAVAQNWDPEGTAEHLGIARAANVDAAALYAVANMTDVRDVLLLGDPPPDEEGCTSFLLPAGLARERALIAGQTWDLNPQDLDYVLALHRTPASGPETWSVGCVGCLTLVGMNEWGLSVGTTNIKVRGSRPGVGYLTLLHRLVRCRGLAEARRLLETAPRSGAHTYWLASGGGAVEYEVSAANALPRELAEAPLARTNHCLFDVHARAQGELTTSSSAARLQRMQGLLAAGGHDLASLQAALSDRSDGVDSIARFPEDEQGTATNACIVAVPARRELWACKGPAQRGRWVALGFERPFAA